MPRPKNDVRQVSIYFPNDTVDWFDELASKYGTTRAAAVNAVVNATINTPAAIGRLDRALAAAREIAQV